MTERRKTPSEQGRKFVEAARALECDESEGRFDAALKKVAAHKPPDPPKEGKDRKSKRVQ